MTVDPMRSTSPFMEEDWGKEKLLKALDGQVISEGSQRYMLTERILTGDAKATINHAALDIGIRTVDKIPGIESLRGNLRKMPFDR